MKKLICSVLILCNCSLYAQENNPQNKPGTTVLNSTSNNSASGVNPNGNPGTILATTTMSNSTNNTLIKPNTTIGNNVIFVPGTSTVVTRETVPTTVNSSNTNVTAPGTVNPPNTVVTTPVIDPNTTVVATTIINNPQASIIVGSNNTNLRPLSNSPVLSNYVPETIVTKLKNTYGNNLYDITMLKKSDNRLLYIVRTIENGVYITHYLDEEGNVLKQ